MVSNYLDVGKNSTWCELRYTLCRQMLVDHAVKLASQIAARSPVAIQGSKVNLNYGRDHTIAQALQYQVRRVKHCTSSFSVRSFSGDSSFCSWWIHTYLLRLTVTPVPHALIHDLFFVLTPPSPLLLFPAGCICLSVCSCLPIVQNRNMAEIPSVGALELGNASDGRYSRGNGVGSEAQASASFPPALEAYRSILCRGAVVISLGCSNGQGRQARRVDEKKGYSRVAVVFVVPHVAGASCTRPGREEPAVKGKGSYPESTRQVVSPSYPTRPLTLPLSAWTRVLYATHTVCTSPCSNYFESRVPLEKKNVYL